MQRLTIQTTNCLCPALLLPAASLPFSISAAHCYMYQKVGIGQGGGGGDTKIS